MNQNIRMLREDEVRVNAPSLWLLLREGSGLSDLAALLLDRRFIAGLPRGDGHPVLVIPGFGASDFSTRPLRKVLTQLGYAVHGWGQGVNLGMPRRVREALLHKIETLHAQTGAKVSLIGWSLGGVLVRELARHSPQHVRRLFTLGSPFNGHPNANNVYALFKLVNRNKPVKLDWDGFQRRRVPPPVPCTAIYSKRDGIVAWQCSIEEAAPNTENVEVRCGHYGLGVSREVLRVIAERLAQREAA